MGKNIETLIHSLSFAPQKEVAEGVVVKAGNFDGGRVILKWTVAMVEKKVEHNFNRLMGFQVIYQDRIASFWCSARDKGSITLVCNNAPIEAEFLLI